MSKVSETESFKTASLTKAPVPCAALVDAFKAKFGATLLRLDVHEKTGGLDGAVQSRDIWAEVEPEAFRPFVENLFCYDFPDFHVMSGDDTGESVTLNYHLSLFQRERNGRVGVTVTVKVPKDRLSMPSIFDLLPGSEYSEREMREMLGVDFVGLPNKALVFLPEDWDEEIKPWRRDESGPKPDMVRELS
ncbi:MAG: NADH-quinone oxidoreductase subunit C [Synergistaceae bacterium]|jgi:membrane-bound hydrogenase subunit beta|nr:NADH-quinone oxidoreductase subunit C [Synergistaceae bacterium]